MTTRSDRVNVSLPAGLARMAREVNPDLNISAVLQDALRAVIGCQHAELACARCGHPTRPATIEDEALGRFYSDALWKLDQLVRDCGTAEGAVRVLKQLALDRQVPGVDAIPLPRPTRKDREWAEARLRERELAETPVPAVRYEDLIADLEGPERVAAWLDLGRVLAVRPGWRFRLLDGLPSWALSGPREVSACASLERGSWTTLTLFCQIGPGDLVDEDLGGVDLGDDVAASWDYPKGQGFLRAVGRLERGKWPVEPPILLGPWIEEAAASSLLGGVRLRAGG